MLAGRNIIYFANDWKASNKTCSHHIVEELSKYNKILYIETSGMRLPRRTKSDLKRIFSRLLSWLRFVRKVSDKFYIYSIIILPFYPKWVYKLTIYLNLYFLKFIIKKLNFKEPILWFMIPDVAYFAKYFESSVIVYYCTDNVSELPGFNREFVIKIEDELLKLAKVVFATSEYLCDRLKERNINLNIFYSPHAVDFSHFSKAQDGNLPVADELKSLRRPIIGFIGMVEKWIDLDLIEYIAKLKPDWSVVLIGRVTIPLGNIKRYDNVTLLGIRKYQVLPSYLKGFDVCILPFRINELTKSVNPIKIKEYLASGKPVVTTRIPELEKFKSFVEIAESYEEFLNKIEQSYKNDNAENLRQRMDFVKEDSWEKKVQKISEIIEDIERSSRVNKSN